MGRHGYATDLTDAQGVVFEPHIPAARTRGRSRRADLQAVTDAILYLLRTGCRPRCKPWCAERSDARRGRGDGLMDDFKGRHFEGTIIL